MQKNSRSGWTQRLLGAGLASRLSSLTAVTLSLLLSTINPAVHAQAVDISSSGMPGYSYPLAVPPGIAGLMPNVGLAYTGGGVNGPLGYGWSLQGLSTITRCPYTRAIDGVSHGVSYDGNDKLCLDGQRLIQVDPATGAVINASNTNPSTTNPFQQNDALGLSTGVREYRTEKDTFSRIRAYGMAGGTADGPAYFIVWTKAGQIYEYGNYGNASANALILARGSTAAAAWSVSRIKDTLGNYIDFQYVQRDVKWGSETHGLASSVRKSDGKGTSSIIGGGPIAQTQDYGHEWNLLEIRYTGNANGTLPQNRVSFVYEDRLDVSDGSAIRDGAETYHLGSKNVSVSRLKQVRTEVNIQGQPVAVKTLNLSYTNGLRTQRSLLQKIQECAGTSTTRCTPATTFSYSAGGDDSYVASANLGSLATAALQSASTGVIPGDFNGDGKTDLLVWSTTPANNKLYLSNGDGSFTQVATATLGLSSKQLFSSDGCYQSTLADINGDGLPDIVRYSGPKQPTGAACSSYGSTEIYMNNGAGGFNTMPYVGPALEIANSGAIDDCMGLRQADGTCSNTNGSEQGLHTGWSRGANFFLLDVDGDGLPDLITSVLPMYGAADDVVDPCISQVCTRVYKGNGFGNFSNELFTNLAHVSVFAQPQSSGGFGSPAKIADVDGDGLLDLNALTTSVSRTVFGNHYIYAEFFSTAPAYRSRGDGNFDPLSAPIPSCKYTIDFNGDGRVDQLCIDDTVAGTGSLSILAADSTLAQVLNFNRSDLVLSDSTHSTVVVDINGDGRQDILRVADDPTQTQVYLSNGDATFSLSTSFNLNNATRQLRKSDGTSDFVLGDFTGRGGTEFLRLKSSPSAGGEATQNTLYLKADPTPPDLLQVVTSGTGLKTTLSWVPMSNSASGTLGARYISDRGTPKQAVYPKIDVMAPIYVVATLSADTGVGSAQTATEFRYSGFKAAYDSRGSQGFREFRRQTPTPDGLAQLVTATQFLQDFPYTGTASISSSWKGGLNDPIPASPLSRSSYSYCNAANPGAQAPAVLTDATTPCSVPAGTYLHRPYLYQSLESGQDLDGTALPSVTTTNVFNAWGDPTSVQVVSAGTSVGKTQSVTRTTTNQYDAPVTDCVSDANCHWILGRLTQASQRNQVPQLGLSASAGTAPFATATSGSAVQPQLSFSVTSGTTSISFGNQLVGGSYPSAVTVTLTNSGGIAAEGLSFAKPSGFTMTSNNCGSTLAGGASCAFTITWAPTQAQTYGGTLSVSSSNASINNWLTLSGTAFLAPTLSNVALTPSTITLGGSAQLSWTAGGGAVSSSAVCTSGLSLSGSGNPRTVTAAGVGTGSCTVTATNGMGTPVTAQVNATVVNAAGTTATFNPTSVTAGGSSSFTWSTTGATSATVSCTAPAVGQGAGTSGSITVTTATGTSGTGRCTVNAVNAADSPSSASANLTVLTPAQLNLTGCTSPLPTTTPTRATMSCTLSNAGQTSVSSIAYAAISGVTISGPTGSCMGNSTCGTVTLTTDTAPKTYSGTLVATPNVGGGASTGVALTVRTVPNISSSGAISSTTTTPTPASGSLSFSNGGQTPTTLTLTVSGGSGLSASTVDCPANGACSPAVTVTSPSAAGSYNGQVGVSSSAGGSVPSPIPVTLQVKTAPAISYSGSISSMTTTPTQASGTLNFTNNGQTPTTLTVNVTGGASPSPASITCPANAACSSSVTIVSPSATGSYNGQVSVTSSAGGSVPGSISISLSVLPQPTVSSSLDATTVTLFRTTTFRWSASNASATSAQCEGSLQGSGTGSASGGSMQVTVAGVGSGSCKATATNAANGSASSTASANALGSPSMYVEFEPTNSVGQGNTVVFHWNAGNVDRVNVSCGNGAQGTVTNGFASGFLTVSAVSASTNAYCTATGYNAAGDSDSKTQTLTINPVGPTLQANVSTDNFSTTVVHTYSIKNLGPGSASGISVALVDKGSNGAGPGQLSITQDACTGASVAVNGTCAIKVNYQKSCGGNRFAQLVVSAPNGTAATVDISASSPNSGVCAD